MPVTLYLFGENGMIANAGLNDSWTFSSGEIDTTAGSSYSHSGIGSTDYEGSLDILIERTGSTVSTTLTAYHADGSPDVTTSASGTNADILESLTLRFFALEDDYPSSEFGTVTLEHYTLTGSISIAPIPEPATIMLMLLSCCAACVKRHRK